MADTVLVDKFAALEAALNAEVMEREKVAHGICVALAAAQHVFLLGTPGVAKSYVLDRALARIEDANKYHVLMTAFTTPDEVFGPNDVVAFKQGRRRRLTDLYLPWADVANLEEIWKSNSAILNALLSILNERKFRDDGAWGDVPLHTMVCSSNELPGTEALAALRDRILLSYEVLPIQEAGNRVRMLELEVDPNPAPLMTWDDVRKATAEVHAMPVSKQVTEVMGAELSDELAEEGIILTDRRLKQALVLVQAEAWLDGCEQAEVEHLTILQHVWERPDQQAELSKVVLARANPLEKETMALLAEVEKIAKEIDAAIKNKPEKFRLGYEIHTNIDNANADLQKLADKAGTSRRQGALIDQVRQRLHQLTVRMIEDVFALSVDSVGGMDDLLKKGGS